MTYGHKPDLSAHRLKMFEECPKELAYYHDKTPEADRGWGPMRKGQVFHRGIELASKARRKDTKLPDVPARDELVSYVDSASIKAGLSPAEHREIREAAGDCASFVNLGGQIADPEHRAVVEMGRGIFAEARFDLLAGERMDMPERWWQPTEEGPGRVVIRDWKTGDGQPLSQGDAETNPQVGIYLVIAHAIFPQARSWEFQLKYVRPGVTVPVRWTTGLDALWRARAIGAVKAWTAGYAPARPGDHCRSCGYRYACQAWLELLEVTGGEDLPLDMPDDLLLSERQRAATAAKLGEKRRKDLDAEIQKRGRATSRLVGQNLEARIHARTTEKVAMEAVLQIAQVRDQDVLSVLEAAGGRISSRKAKALPVNSTEAAIVRRWTTEKKSFTVRVKEVKG